MRKRILLAMACIMMIGCQNTPAEKEWTLSPATGENEAGKVNGETEISVTGKWLLVEINFPEMKESEKEKIINKATIEFRADGNYFSMF